MNEPQIAELQRRLEDETAARARAEVALAVSQQRLLEAHDQFSAVLEAVPGGVSWLSSDLIYLGINRQLAWTFRSVPEAFIGQHIGFLKSSPAFADFVRQFFQTPGKAAFQEIPMEVLGSARTYLIMGQKYRQGEAAVFVGIDITERKQHEEQLLFNAFHDSLTGLANRALFHDSLSRALERTRRRSGYLFAVLSLDLDRFKVLNESLGHTAGDLMLVEAAGRLQSCLKPDDILARMSGDEFVILLDDLSDPGEALATAGKLQQELNRPFVLDQQEAFTTASIGIAISSSTYAQAEEVLRDADIALGRAKSLGRARCEQFDIAMHIKAVSLHQLETDLRHALETVGSAEPEFLLLYQPIMSLGTERMTGLEALVRWQHPRRGMLMPGEFIPVAEETGLIVPLDRWVLAQACRQMQLWRQLRKDESPMTISVNLSSKHVSHPDLVQHVSRTLEQSGLPPSCLNLEITETVIMENPEAATEALTRLRALGVQLSLDDFGTGYSSLSYLHRFPLNTLKIDRCFVNRIGSDTESAEIVRTIVTLAHNLGIDVVVEGVETAEQLAHVKLLHGAYGQGYLFSRPLDGESAAALMAGEMPIPTLPSK